MNTVRFETPSGAEIQRAIQEAHQLRSLAFREMFARLGRFLTFKPQIKTYAFDRALCT